MVYEQIIKELAEEIKPEERLKFLFDLKCAFWGEKRAELQEDILERYDNEEHWKKEE